MKISVNWLKSLVPVEESAQQIADRLSVSGLEVEHIEEWESLPGGLKGFVVGQVLTCEKHPDADRLSVTTVDVGTGEPLNIVCGAPNVATGQKVVVAKVGTEVRIPGKEPFSIGKSKIRGAVSEGMICAEDEMGLGAGHDGIMVLHDSVEVGTLAADYFGIERDTVLEIGLTANRGDAASHLGVARDVAALYGATVLEQKALDFEGFGSASKSIVIENSELCRRYVGVSIEGVEIKESPEWLKNRLKAIDIEPKNNVVDATNYVLHHFGQPVHAFDADCLGKEVYVRLASGQKAVLLDGKEIELKTSDLVIADDQHVHALAGVMGGKSSAVSGETKNLFLEIAHFHPTYVRKSAKAHVINTDASFRFERGIDIENLPNVAGFLSGLILDIAGGRLVGMTDEYPSKREKKTIDLSLGALNQFAGYTYEVADVERILSSLGFGVRGASEGHWMVDVPGWRNDVEQVVDLYEEVMRIYGYDRIPMSGKMQVSLGDFSGMERKKKENITRNYLVDRGLFEAQTNSLVSPEWYNSESLVGLSNPLSADMSVMRESLIPGLLQSVAYNQNRQARRVQLFEFGRVYGKSDSGEFKETPVLAIVLWGSKDVESWEGREEKVDFFSLKRLVSGVLARLDSGLSVADCEIKRVSGAWMKKADVSGEVWSVEIPLKKLYKPSRKQVRYEEASKFFQVRRDLSLVVDKAVGFAQLETLVKSSKMKNLVEFKVFDVFEGKPLDEGKKAISLSFAFNKKDEPMKEGEADASMDRLMKSFEEMGALIRR